MSSAPARPLYLLIATTIFLSAFLLFLVQPIIAKLILPQWSQAGRMPIWRSKQNRPYQARGSRLT